RAVVEERPQVPRPVPGELLGGLAQPFGVLAPAPRPLGLAPRLGHLGEVGQDRQQEPRHPDTLAPALDADATEAVVPVAGADQRQGVWADRQTYVDRAGGELVERCRPRCDLRPGVLILLVTP